MRIDMGTDMFIGVNRDICMDMECMCTDMGIDMCIEMCRTMCICMCLHVR